MSGHRSEIPVVIRRFIATENAAAIVNAGQAVLLFLGLMGEQFRFISEISRDTPLVIEKEWDNFPIP